VRPIDVRNLIRFNTRMGMFICPSDRSNVVAFVHGYQYATAKKCRFAELLSDHIARRYRVKADALGWPHQIARLAERRRLEWMEVYLMVSSELLNSAIDPADKNNGTKR
jgi:hypothetical protein